MTGRPHKAETKAAVMAALLAGQSISEVAKQYNIPPGTVKKWSAAKRATAEGTEGTAKTRIGELLLGYVEVTIEALSAQQKVFADPEWIRKQPADELAVLHGVSADKVVRLLEAMSPDETEPDPEE